MKIKSFSTEQFAGIRNCKPITFADGMNVVQGKNEDGKSTMIYALNCALTRPVNLDLRKEMDKAFVASVLPTSGENTVDVTVAIQEAGKNYTIKKVWDRAGAAASIDFKPENTGLLREKEAEAALKKVTKFGSGVYNNLIFGRQDNEAEILDWCYGFFSSKVSDDMAETKKKIAEAFSAAGGISPDKFMDMINCCLDGDSRRKIKGLTGNWDFSRDLPKKHTKNKRWEKGVGTILEAYYAYEDAKAERDEAVGIEKEIADKTEKIAALVDERAELESEKEELVKQFGAISDREQLQTLYEGVKESREAAEKAMVLWPAAENTLDTLKKLKKAREEKDRREDRKELGQLIQQIVNLEKANQEICDELEQVKEYEKDELKARELSDRIREIHGMLTAAKLRADVVMEPGYMANIVFADGTERKIDGTERIDVDGFVKVNIPGVASVQVYPQELDLEGLQGEQTDKKQELAGILKKYGVDTLSEFVGKCTEFKDKKLILKGNNRDISRLLNGKTLEDYQKEWEQIATDESISIPTSLEEDIEQLLIASGTDSLGMLEGTLTAEISGYKMKYETPDKLPQEKQRFANKETEYFKKLKKYEDAHLLSAEEYHAKDENLKTRLDEIGKAVNERQREIGILSTKEVTDIDGLENKVEEAEQKWIHEKKKYEYYTRIKKDFAALRSVEGDQFGEFYNKFGEYLGMITDGRISLNLAGEGLRLHSGSWELDSSELLSEGTKKTVLLAFRLAVLEYFFPEGDGLVVLDDDLLDMDPDRREQAAKLLNRFAQSNQVIFTTCDPGIAKLLGGNQISIVEN